MIPPLVPFHPCFSIFTWSVPLTFLPFHRSFESLPAGHFFEAFAVCPRQSWHLLVDFHGTWDRFLLQALDTLYCDPLFTNQDHLIQTTYFISGEAGLTFDLLCIYLVQISVLYLLYGHYFYLIFRMSVLTPGVKYS